MISVVAITYNRLDLLKELLAAMECQTLDRSQFDFTIVDDGSTDGSREYLREYAEQRGAGFQLITQKNQGPSAARNHGIRESKGDVIVFVDDDVVPLPGWLAAYQDFFAKHPDINGCGGKIKKKRDTTISRYIDRSRAMHHPVHKDGTVGYLVTANAAYRRASIEDVGGFREDITWPGGEDPDLSYRVIAAGGRLGYCPDAAIRHAHRDTLSGVYRMFFNHGRGKAVLAMNEKDEFSSPWKVLGLLLLIGCGSSVKGQMRLIDRPVNLCCGILRALGFSRGVAFQQRVLRESGAGECDSASK